MSTKLLNQVANQNTLICINGYFTATALGKLGHVDGEKDLTRAAPMKEVIQMIPTLSSGLF
ncbi:uncharacterized protein MELLADRAFT_86460 [Melampsora larici-populina 98AG31]|uniref:Uncharacterized protein n=1 Tax=Melampsora larici-populina (strain 98AG31 / pathotype 3-4-7) TaxID=747676 RepID=F4RLW8_MELLP|nr:uncharacterized protein MELLADRAFT_86460 [Melampsora larici-populina 98AG31]EGG06614.1 hypothetical protein MELLADRAFT_86460 [Melampsora larici-populina 98AG31]